MAALERPKHVGILAAEVYFPSTYVSQTELEAANGVSSGKYTIGLGQEAMAFTGDREDINSICLTAVAGLLEKHEIHVSAVGRLEVGTETLIDKSKSTKTVLMSLFEGNTDVEGITTVNACYGGTAALLNAVAWVESSGWDGRYAIVVAADIAVYAEGPARPTGGCGAVAVLVGPDAPLPLRMDLRTTHACDVWDFFKPDMSSEYPTVNGALSQTCYLRALDDCYGRLAAKLEAQAVASPAGDSPQGAAEAKSVFTSEQAQHYVFHAPYNKLVQKSFARLLLTDARRLAAAGKPLPEALAPLAAFVDKPVEETYTDRELEGVLKKLSAVGYKKLAAPSSELSRQIGNTYTASVFGNLVCLVDAFRGALAGTRVLLFSYGSGAVATMYQISPREPTGSHGFTLEKFAKVVDLQGRLASREQLPPAELTAALASRLAMHSAPFQPTFPVNRLFPGTFYLDKIASDGTRSYSRVPLDGERVTGGILAPSLAAAAAGRGHDDAATTDGSEAVSDEESSDAAAQAAAAAAASEAAKTSPRGRYAVPRIVVTGVACGLPGQAKVFGPENLQRLLAGESCLAPLEERTKAALLEKNVVELKRSPTPGAPAERKAIVALDETIQVAARLGSLDLTDYGVSPSIAATMDKSVKVAVAAGLEALKDAGLVAGGSSEKEAWQLPEHLRDGTGVVYASSFPALDAAIGEVMRFLRSRCITRAKKFQLLAALRERLRVTSPEGAVGSDDEKALRSLEKGLITRSAVNLVALGNGNGNGASSHDSSSGGGPNGHVANGSGHDNNANAKPATLAGDEEEPVQYEFDRKFLFRVLVLGNAQLAQIVGARGPNLQTNAACAGSTQAVAVAQDMLQLCRCERMVVIAGDDVSGEALIPWIGNGFRALGAASIANSVTGAALPFDARRNGMLLGAGAIGIVLETELAAARRHCEAAGLRGAVPAAGGGGASGSDGAANTKKRPSVKARLLETQISNSAYHGASMDKEHIAVELERFLGAVKEHWGVSRERIAREGVYFSHETCTHATPTASCAYNEVFALRRCFGDLLPHMTIINTKGFTGHPMGVSFEDVAAVEVLLNGIAPPVPKYCTPDPNLGDLKLSSGGPVTAKYALRFAAGFGSQVAFALYAAVEL